MENHSSDSDGTRLPGAQSQTLLERLSNPRNLLIILFASLVLLGIMIGAAIYISQPPTPPFEPPVSLESLAEQYPDLAGILQDAKLGSVYKEFLVVYQNDGEDAAYNLAKQRGLINDKDEVRLTLELDTSDAAVMESLKAELEAAGIRVTAMAGNLVDLAIPLEVLVPVLETGETSAFFGTLTGLEHVIRIRLPSTIQSKHLPESMLQVDTEAMAVIGADRWHKLGFTGQGVKVGVLDLQFDGYQDLLGSELPENVTVSCFCDGGQIDQMGGVHGTAVAEIIHDIAPDAELFLAAFQTDAEFQQAVQWLVSQGVRIISNSTGSNWGPKDGSSRVTQFIDSVVKGGVLWVNSAGNAADGHYRAEFTDQDGDSWHDELIYFETFGDDSITLNWNAWSQGDQDYDLFIYDQNNNLLASSQDSQTGPDSPSGEYISISVPESGERLYAAIQAAKTSGNYVLDFFTNNGTIDANLISKEYSLDEEATSKLGLAVGAVYWKDDNLEPYSSQGPTNDGRLKPEISAPSVVSGASYGTEGFNGTSAATPHVSAAAALVLSAAPGFTVNQIKDYLFKNAIDLGASGPDYQFGNGRLFLRELPVEAPAAPTAAAPTPGQLQNTPEGATPIPTLAATQAARLEPTAEIGFAISTATAQPTYTPKPVLSSIELSSSDTLLLVGVLGTLGCLGMGGIALVGFVWLRMSSRRRRLEAAYIPEHDQLEMEANVLCPNCGTPNRRGAKFCQNCGFTL